MDWEFQRIGFAVTFVTLVASSMYLPKESVELGSEALAETYYFLEIGRQR